MMESYIITLIFLIIGLLICFNGFKIQKAAITIIWFIIGFSLIATIGSYFAIDAKACLLLQILVGLILACIGYKIEKLAIFIAVSYMTFHIISTYVMSSSEIVALVIKIVLSLGIGAISLLFIKPAIIIATGIFGANMIVTYLPILLSSLILLSSSVITILLIVFAILGIIIQFKNS